MITGRWEGWNLVPQISYMGCGVTLNGNCMSAGSLDLLRIDLFCHCSEGLSTALTPLVNFGIACTSCTEGRVLLGGLYGHVVILGTITRGASRLQHQLDELRSRGVKYFARF